MPEEAEEDGAPIDPFADLLFTLIAAVLPAILVLIPAMHLASAGPAAQAPQAPAEIRVEGMRAAPIIAEAAGLRLTGEGDRRVALDAIQDDRGLRAGLRRLRDAGLPLLLVVEPDGLESAFLLEPVLAADGPRAVHAVRAATSCAAAAKEGGTALAAACAAGRGAASVGGGAEGAGGRDAP